MNPSHDQPAATPRKTVVRAPAGPPCTWVYARLGFSGIEKSERFMERHRPMPYKAAA